MVRRIYILYLLPESLILHRIEEEFKLYEKLLIDTLHGNVEAVKAAFNSVKRLRAPYLNPLQPVAALGAWKGHMEIIRFALDRGVKIEHDFCLGVSYGSAHNDEVAKYWEENKIAFNEII